MSKTAIEGASRGTTFYVDPSILMLITDRSHPLYDKRVELPVSEELVQSMMVHGWFSNKPAAVRKNGDLLEVNDGRQRTKAAVEANRRRKAEGLPEIRAHVVVVKGDDISQFERLVVSNGLDQKDDVVELANKAKRLIDLGRSEKEAAISFGVTEKTISNWMKLHDCAPEVIAAVRAGRVGAHDAALKISTLPRDKQVEALKEIETSGKKVVDEAVSSRGGKARKGKGLGKGDIKRLLKIRPEAFNAREKLLLGYIIGQVSRGEVAEKFPELAR